MRKQLKQNKYFKLPIRVILTGVILLVSFNSTSYANGHTFYKKSLIIGLNKKQNNQSLSELVKGEKLVKQLKGAETHNYLLKLEANQYLDLIVDQKGIDVVVRLLSPDSKLIVEVDSPNGSEGIEPLSFISEIAGNYLIQVASLEKDAEVGNYQIEIKAKRTATEQDKTLISAKELDKEVESLCQEGKYNQALPIAERALAVKEKALGLEDINLAVSINNLAVIYQGKGEYEKVEFLFNRLLAIEEKVLGTEHIDVSDSLNNLAAFYQTTGKYDKAELLLQKSLAIREKVLGSKNLKVAQSLNNLAVVYETKADYEKAERLIKRALNIQEELLGSQHLEVAQSLNTLAAVYYSRGQYSKAISLLERALAIKEKALRAEDPSLALSINNLGLLYQERSEYDKSELLLQKALSIREKTLGSEHPDVAVTLNNLASLYKEKGRYDKAEPLFQKALSIREKAFGLEHPNVAESIDNLGLLFRDKGDYEKVVPLFQRALEIREKVFGSEHPLVALSFANLAVLYRETNQYDKAEKFYQKALMLKEKVLGLEHPSLANSLNNLAFFYQSKEEYKKAEPLYQRALEIREKTLGLKHPLVAESLNNLAMLYQVEGNYEKVEAFYQRALNILEENFGSEHPNLATCLNNLIEFNLVRGKVNVALNYKIKANEIREKEFLRNLTIGSEKQKLLYINKTAYEMDKTLTLSLQTLPNNLQAAQCAMTAILRRKGRALDVMANLISKLRSRASKEDIELLDQLSEIKAKLSAKTLSLSDKNSLANYRKQIKILEKQEEDLENKISSHIKDFKIENTPINLQDVQQRIPQDVLLIEYITYKPYSVRTRQFSTPHYAVYLLNAEGNLKWIDLGEVGLIDKAVNEFRQVLIKEPKRQLSKVNTQLKPKAWQLHKLIVSPLEKFLGKTTKLFISPDGDLNLIPFEALVDSRNQYLVKKYEISYLSSGRDLLRVDNESSHLTSPIIISDPDYGKGKGPTVFNKTYPPLARLVGTSKEGQEIQQILPNSKLIEGQEAKKTFLTSIKSPEILHIATHGYFLEKVKLDTSEPNNRKVSKNEDLSRIFVQQDENTNVVGLRQANPLLCSWLFFADANNSQENQAILTALEAASLDLLGTKLVVLSACETGLGEVKNGEGVYGLRRALVLAGSQSQMISLWSVSDRATRDLMIGYYKNLKTGDGRSLGLRKVKLDLLKNPKYSHPYYWASFIQSGDARALGTIK